MGGPWSAGLPQRSQMRHSNVYQHHHQLRYNHMERHLLPVHYRNCSSPECNPRLHRQLGNTNRSGRHRSCRHGTWPNSHVCCNYYHRRSHLWIACHGPQDERSCWLKLLLTHDIWRSHPFHQLQHQVLQYPTRWNPTHISQRDKHRPNQCAGVIKLHSNHSDESLHHQDHIHQIIIHNSSHPRKTARYH